MNKYSHNSLMLSPQEFFVFRFLCAKKNGISDFSFRCLKVKCPSVVISKLRKKGVNIETVYNNKIYLWRLIK